MLFCLLQLLVSIFSLNIKHHFSSALYSFHNSLTVSNMINCVFLIIDLLKLLNLFKKYMHTCKLPYKLPCELQTGLHISYQCSFLLEYVEKQFPEQRSVTEHLNSTKSKELNHDLGSWQTRSRYSFLLGVQQPFQHDGFCLANPFNEALSEMNQNFFQSLGCSLLWTCSFFFVCPYILSFFLNECWFIK